MSQRLHIGETAEEWYDCVIDKPEGVFDLLTRDWLCLAGGYWIGPLRMRIADIVLFWQVEGEIEHALRMVGAQYPGTITHIYCDGDDQYFSSALDLRAWLRWHQANRARLTNERS